MNDCFCMLHWLSQRRKKGHKNYSKCQIQTLHCQYLFQHVDPSKPSWSSMNWPNSKLSVSSRLEDETQCKNTMFKLLWWPWRTFSILLESDEVTEPKLALTRFRFCRILHIEDTMRIVASEPGCLRVSSSNKLLLANMFSKDLKLVDEMLCCP